MGQLAKLSAERCKDLKTSVKLNADKLFNGDGDVSTPNLYLAYFGYIPNVLEEIKINCLRAIDWLMNTYSGEITDCHYSKRHFMGRKVDEYEFIYCTLFEDLMLLFNPHNSRIHLLFRKTDREKVQAIIDGIRKFKMKRRKKANSISLLVNGSSGLETSSMTVTRPKLTI
ncbi:MAG: hypothetical protein LBO74_00270, partial [Candidatus Symbiothrix sp.]|nr:hypothetical protein [Candidatus Symbiothrix sp.]